MKKIIFTICFLLSSAIMVMAQSMSYKIEGQLDKSVNGEVVLVANNEKGATVIDNSIIKNGAFEFKGEISDVTVAFLMPKDRSSVWATMFLENGEYTISAIGNDITVNGGGKSQEIYNEFDAVNKYITKVKQQFDLKEKSTSNTNQLAALRNIRNETVSKTQYQETELLKKYSDSFVSAYVIASTMLSVDEKILKERYELLNTNIKYSFYGKQILTYLTKLENIAIGAYAPDFSAPLADGGTIKLKEVKGRVKIVYFWASWSAPCRDENVNMLKLYRQYRPKGLDIIGVSLDDNKKVWLKALGEDGATWKNIMDTKDGKSRISSLYCVSELPSIFVLGEDDKIVAKNIQGEELKDLVEEMLKKK